ncbi:MAG: hypothetical protein LBP69_00050 [Treponema sp.]|jgi:hypothetical protein|nr:hypothetical protein [Treponema sp.]
MKKMFWRLAAGLWLLCSSCAVFPPPVQEAWSSAGTVRKGTMAAGKISVDSVTGWDSLETEIAGLLPLLLLEKGYAAPDTESGTDFTADVSAIEREYMEGWKTKKSLSIELRIRGRGDVFLAAGRAMISGDKSLASSQVTNVLLRSALSKALSALEADSDK